VLSAVTAMIVYHTVLAVLSRVAYHDTQAMAYPHLRQRYKKVLWFSLTGARYLTLFTVGVTIWNALCAGVLRLILLGHL